MFTCKNYCKNIIIYISIKKKKIKKKTYTLLVIINYYINSTFWST